MEFDVKSIQRAQSVKRNSGFCSLAFPDTLTFSSFMLSIAVIGSTMQEIQPKYLFCRKILAKFQRHKLG